MKNKLLITLLFSLIIWSTKSQVTSIIENFDNTTGSNMPTGWAGSNVLGTNYGTGNFYADHTTGTGRFAFGSNGYFCTQLVAAGTYNVSFWMRISSSTENILLGYCTNQSSIASTFTTLQTINNNLTTWTLYSYTLILPVNAYVTWSCYGGAKTHVIDDFSLSPATGIETGSKKDNSFEITPNPSTGLFQLNNSSGNVVNFKVCNETGNAVMQSVLNKTQSTIDLSNQPDGIYFVEFNNNNKTFVRKLVKVK